MERQTDRTGSGGLDVLNKPQLSCTDHLTAYGNSIVNIPLQPNSCKVTCLLQFHGLCKGCHACCH